MGIEAGCVHGCRHPLWGGAGTCLYSADPVVCTCDTGYSTRDAMGNASCVPRRILTTIYLILGIVSIMAAVLVFKHTWQFRYLSAGAQASRKTMSRIRVLLPASVYLIGFGFVGLTLACRTDAAGYVEDGIVQVIYIVLLPSMMFGVAMIAEFWVGTLPRQLLSPDSFAGMLRKASESSGVFVLVGAANASPISAIGVLTFFFADWPQRIADMVMTAGTLTAMAVILFVAFRMTRVIDQALAKGTSSSSKTFYVKAKKNLWLQAMALCGVGFLTVSVTAIKRLTLAGRSTPIILGTLQILTGHAAVVIFASATKFDVPPVAVISTYADSSSGPRMSRSSAVMALSGAASAMNRLWWKQQERLPEESATLPDGRCLSTGDRADWLAQGRKIIPVVTVKPGPSGNRPSRHFCNAVVPLNEQPGDCDESVTSPKSWTLSSLDDVEQLQELTE